jgi:hypothetical protein
MLIVDGKTKTFNIFAIGLGLTGASLWILSMLGPAFALHLQHASPLSAWAYDSQVACFLALLIATMYAIAVQRALAQLILGISFFILYLWLKSVLNLTAGGNIAMVAGSVLIAAAAVLRHIIPAPQDKAAWRGARFPITVFIAGSLATAMGTLLPLSIWGKALKAFDVPGFSAVLIVSLIMALTGSLLVLIDLNNNRQRTWRTQLTASPGEDASSWPTTSNVGVVLILAGISGLVVCAFFPKLFPVLDVQILFSGPGLRPAFSTSNLLDSPNHPYFAGAFLILLGLSIVLLVTKHVHGALASTTSMLALTFLRLWFLPAEAEQIRKYGLFTGYSIVWESWIALMMGNWLMILSCLLSIQHFRRQGFLKLDEIEESI